MLLILYARSKKYNTVNDLRRGLKSHFAFVLGTIVCICTISILQSLRSARYQAGLHVHGPCKSRCCFRFCLDDSQASPASDDRQQHKSSRLSSSKLRNSQAQSPITTYTNKHTTSSTSTTYPLSKCPVTPTPNTMPTCVSAATVRPNFCPVLHPNPPRPLH